VDVSEVISLVSDFCELVIASTAKTGNELQTRFNTTNPEKIWFFIHNPSLFS
jgi:hypothetical protein